IDLSYTWGKAAVQGAGLVARARKRGVHRKRRERRPLPPGMRLHIDGSHHRWFQDERGYDLIVIVDDATSEIYNAQLVEEESSLAVLAGLKEVIPGRGVFCALDSDRASHFWLTPKTGSQVDPQRLTQVGRGLRELGVQMIPADSPQARGRSERNFGTWPGRLPQELRLHGIPTLEAAQYTAQSTRRFQVRAREPGSAFVRRSRRDLDLIFALPYQRTVNRDNTVSVQNLQLQIEPVRWRATLAGGTVTVHQHLDGTFTLLTRTSGRLAIVPFLGRPQPEFFLFPPDWLGASVPPWPEAQFDRLCRSTIKSLSLPVPADPFWTARRG